MKAIFMWFLTNSVFSAALYFGFIEGIQGAQNIVQFVTWFTIIVSFVLVSDAASDARIKKGTPFSVPIAVDIIFDVVVVGIFVWFNWTWTAAFYVVHIVLFANFRNTVEAKLKQLNNKGA